MHAWYMMIEVLNVLIYMRNITVHGYRVYNIIEVFTVIKECWKSIVLCPDFHVAQKLRLLLNRKIQWLHRTWDVYKHEDNTSFLVGQVGGRVWIFASSPDFPHPSKICPIFLDFLPKMLRLWVGGGALYHHSFTFQFKLYVSLDTTAIDLIRQ